jgi:ABC-2 type transport system permease protein
MIQPGTALWFARHETRLAWRDWIAMMTAGRRDRLWKVAIGFAVFVILMHAVAYSVVGRFAGATADKPMLVAITASLLLSWLLMASQAMESMTRAFYARADLDLILASPVAVHRLFAVRIATVALSVALMALPLAAPFIDMLVVRDGWRWLGVYGVIAAMGAAAAAFAVVLTAALFHACGPKRTRLVAQVVAAAVGAVFVIGVQVTAILSYGTPSRGDLLQSPAVLALAALLLAGAVLLAGAIAIVAPRFADYTMAAAGAGGAFNLLVPVLVMAAGQLAGGLAWLTISGEDAPDLVATAPIAARSILRAKVEAVLGIIALVFAPLVVVLAAASLWHALVTGIAIVITAAAATAIQHWFRSQAKRSQFRRRQVSSRIATFAEAFSSIGWAGAAAVAAVSLPLTVIPALLALAVLGGARALSPRRHANAQSTQQR